MDQHKGRADWSIKMTTVICTALLFGLGCAKTDWIDRTLVTVDVTGAWTGSVVSPDGQPAINSDVRLEMQQNGSKVIGSFIGTVLGTNIRGSVPIEGSVAGDMFTFKDARGAFSGELAVSGDEMRGQGTIGSGRPVTINLRRVDASLTPTSPTR
jgi:hypothetical protein